MSMQGTIEIVGPRPKRTVERDFVSEVEKWIEREASSDREENGAYNVLVTSEGDPPFYHCRVEALLDGCRWLAQGSGLIALEPYFASFSCRSISW